MDDARTLLALESLDDPTEQERLRLEEAQVREIREKRRQAERDLKERVWRTYRRVLFLAEDNRSLQETDLGLVHSSAAESLVGFILTSMRQEGVVEEGISPDFLVRNWPPALAEEWSTRKVREMFFASPQFPRLLDPEVLRETIARGVREGKFGYVGKADGGYQGPPIIGDPHFNPEDVQFSDQVVLIPREKALALLGKGVSPAEAVARPPQVAEPLAAIMPGVPPAPTAAPGPERRTEFPPTPSVRRLRWEGDLPPQKWTNFYIKVLTRFATDPSLRLVVRFEVEPEAGVSQSQLEELEAALRELGLDPKAVEVVKNGQT